MTVHSLTSLARDHIEGARLNERVERSRPRVGHREVELAAVIQASSSQVSDATVLVPLPVPSRSVEEEALHSALQKRRSGRVFADDAISLDSLAATLTGYSVSGSLDTRRGAVQLRTAPSAGALYPVDTYLVASRVDGLERGLYRYDPLLATLLPVARSATLDTGMRGVFGDHTYVDQPAATIFLALRIDALEEKYGERGYRYGLIETGHVAQTYLLCAATAGLQSLTHGAFFDDAADRLLNIDRQSANTVLALFLGKSAPETQVLINNKQMGDST